MNLVMYLLCQQVSEECEAHSCDQAVSISHEYSWDLTDDNVSCYVHVRRIIKDLTKIQLKPLVCV